MRKVEFGEIATFSQGQQVSIPDQKTEKFDGCDTFLRIVNYTQNSDDFRYIPKQSHKHHVSTDDIIMVRYGAVGFVGRGLSGVLANNMFKINFDKDQVDGNYLYRTLWSNFVQKQLLNASQSTSMAAINFKTTSKITIPLPPLDQQKKIAAILDAADAYKQKTKALIEKYDELTQSLFLEMFGDPVTNPKGWDEVIFTDVLILRRGFDLPVQDRTKGEYPIMASNGILDWHNDFKVQGPGVVTGRSGTLGHVHLVEADYWPLNTALYSQDLNGNNPTFLLFLVRNFRVERFSRGAGVPTLNRNLVHAESIMKIPIDLQNQFAERVKVIESQKAQAEVSLAQAEDLFNSLLQRAFKGELV